MTRHQTHEELKQRVKALEEEVELLKSDELVRVLRLAVEQSIDGIAVADTEGGIRYANPSFAEMCGYTPEEMIGMDLRDLHSSEQIKTLVHLTKEMQGEGSWREASAAGELGRIKKDGTLLPTYESITVLKGDDGKPTRALVICRDMTDARKTQDELERLKSAVDMAADGIALCSKERRLIYVNKAYAEMRGYTPEEMVGMELDTLHMEEHAEQNARVRDQVYTEGAWQGETWQVRKDGSSFPAFSSYSRLLDRDGNPSGALSICRDISVPHEMTKALQESEEKYRKLFENANDAVFIADMETKRILDANKQAERLLGRSRQEIIGMHQLELHPPDDAEFYEDKFNGLMQRGWGPLIRGKIQRKDGRAIPVDASGNVISISGKQVVQGMFRDLTGEQKLSEMKERLAENKLVDKAKRILVERYDISEEDALRRIRKASRDQRKKIKDIANAVISSERIFE